MTVEQCSALDILGMARDEIAPLAEEVGVDAVRLLKSLPHPGTLLKGRQVPVTEKRYRGACYVLFHVNRTRSGQEWPFLQFHTFKDGGNTLKFNGLRWLIEKGGAVVSSAFNMDRAQIGVGSRQTEAQQIISRQRRHASLDRRYRMARPLGLLHPWLQSRLCGYSDASLLERIDLRPSGQDLMIPLHNGSIASPGYQIICPGGSGDQKLIYPRVDGGSKGSYMRVAARPGHEVYPVALCEGVSTALTLALVWPGEIRAALGAHNLGALRRSMDRDQVFIFYDNDLWSERAGNIGLSKALQAAVWTDRCFGPQFDDYSMRCRPSDFNDLLMLEGIDALRQQVQAALMIAGA